MPDRPNFAWSAATARSHIDTSWQPAAAAAPCTRAITGCGNWVSFIIIAVHAVEERALPRVIDVRAHLGQVVAGAERASCARENDHARVGVGGNGVERFVERGNHRRRQRIEAIAAIHRHRAHAVANLGDDVRDKSGFDWCVHEAPRE